MTATRMLGFGSFCCDRNSIESLKSKVCLNLGGVSGLFLSRFLVSVKNSLCSEADYQYLQYPSERKKEAAPSQGGFLGFVIRKKTGFLRLMAKKPGYSSLRGKDLLTCMISRYCPVNGCAGRSEYPTDQSSFGCRTDEDYSPCPLRARSDSKPDGVPVR